MTELSVPGASRAILIGVSTYETLEDLPSVNNNLTGLHEALTNPVIWGLPAANCKMLHQPQSSDIVLNTLQELGSSSADTLVFYFAGHGLIDPENDDELYLALPRSDRDRAYRTAVPYSWVRREMKTTKARRRVVILDCCYSGRALGWMGDDTAELADRLEIEGTCVLTATARTRRALAPPEQRFTAFSGELIALLTEGIASGPDVLDMDTIYQHLTTRLRARSLPLPQRGEMNRGGNIALARNRMFQPQLRSAPTHDSLDVAPPPMISGSWRQLIDPDQEVKTTRANSISYGSVVRSALVMILAACGWAASAGYLAWMWNPHGWLWAAGAVGLASLIGAAMRKQPARFALRFLAVPSFAAYVFAAIAGNGHWLERVLIAGVILFPVLVLWAMAEWKFEAEFNKNYNSQGKRQRLVAELVQQTLWLTDSRPDPSGLALLDPLMNNIPAARFSCLTNSCFQFLVVAGERVLFVALVRQAADVSAKVGIAADTLNAELGKAADELKIWRKLFGRTGRVSVRVMLIGPPELLTLPGGANLRVHAGSGIAYTTMESFAEAAGLFLADGAYELNLRVLELLHSRLHSTSSETPSARKSDLYPTAAGPAARNSPSRPTAVLPSPGSAPSGSPAISLESDEQAEADSAVLPELE